MNQMKPLLKKGDKIKDLEKRIKEIELDEPNKYKARIKSLLEVIDRAQLDPESLPSPVWHGYAKARRLVQ